MKSLIKAFMAIALLFGFSQATLADGHGKQKVVYHINYDNPKQQGGALRNIQNHINAVGADKLDLRVVLHGNGLALLVLPEAHSRLPKFKHANANDQMAAKIDGLRNQGVSFKVCANTLKGKNVNLESDLHDVSQADVVPSGVAELAILQGQGFAYIKP